MRKFMHLIFFLAAVVILAEFLLPGLVEDRIRDHLLQYLDAYGAVDVNLGIAPAIRILTGAVDRLTIRAHGVRLEGAPEIETIEADFRDIKINVYRYLLEGELVFQSIENEHFEMVVTERAVNSYFSETLDYFQLLSFRFLPGEALMGARLKLWDHDFEFKMGGTFKIVEWNASQAAQFEVERVSVERLELPGVFFNTLVEDLVIGFDLDDFAFPVHLREVEIMRGRLVVYGGM